MFAVSDVLSPGEPRRRVVYQVFIPQTARSRPFPFAPLFILQGSASFAVKILPQGTQGFTQSTQREMRNYSAEFF